MSSTEAADRLHVANVLGALALAIGDRVSEAVAGAAGQASSAAAALSALDQFLDGASIDALGRVLGLTSSGAVRLVDRLEASGHVRRDAVPGDARATAIRLTAGGRRAARRVEAARLAALEQALAPLSAEQMTNLDTALSRMLVGLMRGPEATRWICRVCDFAGCGRSAGRCSIANEAERRYGRAAVSARAATVLRRPRRRRPAAAKGTSQ